MKEPPGKAIVRQHAAPVSSGPRVGIPSQAKRCTEVVSGLEHDAVLRECEALENQVEALQVRLLAPLPLCKELWSRCFSLNAFEAKPRSQYQGLS